MQHSRRAKQIGSNEEFSVNTDQNIENVVNVVNIVENDDDRLGEQPQEVETKNEIN
jgi:hypothetical protein